MSYDTGRVSDRASL